MAPLNQQPQLPTEILTQILLLPQLSIYDIRTISQTSRRMREIVTNSHFGQLFLAMDVGSLSFDISVETDVSTFDVLYYGISAPSDLESDKENQQLQSQYFSLPSDQSIFLLQVVPESMHVKICRWKLGASGRVHFTSETQSIAQQSSPSNRWKCSLWQKSGTGISPSRNSINETDLWNNEGRLAVPSRMSSAGFSVPGQETIVSRYGLRMKKQTAVAIERFFGFPAVDDDYDDDEVKMRESTPEEQPIIKHTILGFNSVN
ncbi:hypothetical protein BCR33DRAFT_714526 [Rhizoclosmatium globosum]|uniref:F-box domain-containing protein n=1 Tax=Rhizoclosmatium globosum TaxID=329046 RepID=A0A1Y2CMN6_9FUNG|nr:hypothetical protein BCR33DRAFT_714526 [Rhizoclosmatium globosum]|eukprot:ORY48094.1 hypothetical protein BCR33DRAFT_714526 [Rhizoclosmatium globosum]